MNKRVLIIHGWGGSSYPHWQAVLAADLIKEDYTVSFPSLPNKDLPTLKLWKEYLKKEILHFKPDIVVCHSLGNILYFHLLDELDIQIEKLLLVAPVRLTCDVAELKSFFPYPYPKNLKAKEVVLAASSDDIYMNIEEANEFKNVLGINMEVFKDAGHINADSGFGRFDFAHNFITKDIK